MDKAKRERLARMGGGETTLEEFLDLSPAQAALLEMQVNLSECVRRVRQNRKVTQAELARRMGTQQSNIARLENGSSGATVDYLVRALLVLGCTTPQISAAISGDLPDEASAPQLPRARALHAPCPKRKPSAAKSRRVAA